MVSSASDLVKDVEHRVAVRSLLPGDRLPPVREQAAALGLAPNTVASAYRRLRDRGVVVGRGRQGTLIAEHPLVTAAVAHSVPRGVVDAMSGNPDSSLLPDISGAIAHGFGRIPGRYGDPLVNGDLASAGRRLFEADGVDARHLTVASGAMDAIERALQAHLRQGDRVGVEDPGYASVLQWVGGLGLAAVPVAMDEEGMRPEALAGALDQGLAAVITTPRSSNPTGSAFTPERAASLSALLDAAPQVFVIEDDHAGPVAGVDFIGARGRSERWVTIRSVSKSLGPDLRVALVAGDPDTISRIEGRLQVGAGWVSHLLQATVAHLLVDPGTQAVVGHAGRQYTHRRDRLKAALGRFGIGAHARSGLGVWIPVSDEQGVVMAMLERGYAVRAGGIYRILAPPAVRVTTAALTDDLIDGLATAMSEVLGARSVNTRIA